MSKVPMKRIFICGLKSERKQVLETLQRIGTVQITEDKQDDDYLCTMDVSRDKSSFDRNCNLAEQALAVLDAYAPDETAGILSSLEGAQEIGLDEYNARLEHIDAYIEKAKELLALNRQLTEDKAALPRAESRLMTLKPWMDLDLPLNFKGTERTACLIGSLKNEHTAEEIKSSFQTLGGEDTPESAEINIISASKEMTCIFVLCLKEEAERTEEILKQMDFTRAQMSSMVPSEEAEQLEEQMKDLELDMAACIEKIRTYEPDRNDLRFASDYYQMRSEKYSVLGTLPQTESTFIINGYIPARYADWMKNFLTDRFDCEVEISDPAEDEDVPVELRNGFYAEPMEAVVASYSLPTAGEIDPSKILSLFYYLFFGLMLSDAGYGLLLSLGCGYALLKVKNMKEGSRKLIKTFFFGGLFTIFWGVLFGSYFGDSIPVIARTFFHKEVTIKPLWFEPLSNPVKLLTFAFGLGVVHLFTGLAIKGYQLVREGKVFDAVCDVLFWFMFIGGAIVFALSSQMISGMLQLTPLPASVGTAAKWICLAGMLGVILTTARDKKNIFLRLGLGLYGVYGATSWLSDILSYSRLLALGLATGVIAQVFNTLGSMFGAGFFGILLFILVFLIGHTLNLGINLLGAYVHTNRLQYVEFFSKFYEGGGRAFEPFQEKTRYYSVKEEK